MCIKEQLYIVTGATLSEQIFADIRFLQIDISLMGSPAQCRDQWVPVHGRKYFQDSASWCNGALIFAELPCPASIGQILKLCTYGIMERYNSPALLHSERYNSVDFNDG